MRKELSEKELSEILEDFYRKMREKPKESWVIEAEEKKRKMRKVKFFAFWCIAVLSLYLTILTGELVLLFFGLFIGLIVIIPKLPKQRGDILDEDGGEPS